MQTLGQVMGRAASVFPAILFAAFVSNPRPGSKGESVPVAPKRATPACKGLIEQVLNRSKYP